MTIHDFIFTRKSPDKYYRHVIFWLVQYFFWTFWTTIFFVGLTASLKFGLQYNGAFILHAVYTYLIAYYFSPKYFETKQYVKFSIAIFILSLIAYILFVFYLLWFFNQITGYFKGFRESSDHQQLLMSWYFSMNFISTGPPAICTLFLTGKMMKNYYIKMEERQTIVKESANAEMQLLRAQVHPHFLFNTLNNIYSFALNKSPEAGNLILKLKDTTKYMVYECDTALMPLQKEIKMLKDYLELEKVRYGKRLEIEINIDGECENKMITPLLMIPFVENSFKHGASRVLREPWIKLFIQADEDLLHFTLTNSKPPEEAVYKNNGIGLKNVKKRLALLYPEKHYLQIESTAHTFTVNMQIPLQQTKNLDEIKHEETFTA